MTKLIIQIVTLTTALIATTVGYAQKNITVDHFEKAIISPHVEVVFKQGETESVVIENSKVEDHKINVEVEGKNTKNLSGWSKNGDQTKESVSPKWLENEKTNLSGDYDYGHGYLQRS